MDIEKRDDLNPICPHCEQELTNVYMNTKLRGEPGLLGLRGDYGQVYFCPHCRKVLGFADWSAS